MNQKSFLMLGGATALSLVAAGATLFGSGNAPAFAEAGEPLFPGLSEASADVASLEIREGDFAITIESRDGVFVDAASGFPVDPDPLRDLVSGMTMATIAEAKTADPARHADLQLAAIGDDEGAGSEIILRDGDGDTLAHVIAGQRDFTLGGVTGGQYVRRGDEDATWLVHARLDPPISRAGWFDTRLMEVDAVELTGATLTTEDGSVIAMSGADGTLTIDQLLMTGRVPAENQLNRIVRLFETLDFADVRAGMASGSEAAGPALQASLEDGTTITLTQVSGSDGADETRWFRIDASGNTELAATTAGFEFSMSSSDAEVFSWTLDDLTEETAS
ncbi:protein of unknown function [Lutimaribacter pacificus]|uniref:DUF4340 domain-containing protein n=1 Tax=Lutimaribacter pacificus TaxID=391948 RepID=A0A1H0NK40_9RHOB|nr:DUF4340 domain-containing protein [Lutimaribacter pacificus]SDO93001.1 protein of unknown function [Lutimaribacter pacificus]SHK88622.1 protein of unknown function [Lutimaribacter pacificus]